jgi:NDP-sugar pyrophosphorylase family protein
MAGGLGTRLGELTRHKPKPMMDINGRPVLELVLERLKKHGAEQVWISVNYKADVIEEYFGDGSDFGLAINYVRETKRMGTAGSLSLLPDIAGENILIMNADLITEVDFSNFVHFHEINQSPFTVGIRRQDYEIPYGVVETDNEKLLGVHEKPTYSYFVNAGIYLCKTDLLLLVPEDEFFDMPSLINKAIENEIQPVVFPVHEDWIDIGRIQDLEIARERNK